MVKSRQLYSHHQFPSITKKRNKKKRFKNLVKSRQLYSHHQIPSHIVTSFNVEHHGSTVNPSPLVALKGALGYWHLIKPQLSFSSQLFHKKCVHQRDLLSGQLSGSGPILHHNWPARSACQRKPASVTPRHHQNLVNSTDPSRGHHQ